METKLILLLQGLLGAIAGGLGYAVLQQKRGERSTGLRAIFALSVVVIFLASSVLEQGDAADRSLIWSVSELRGQ